MDQFVTESGQPQMIPGISSGGVESVTAEAEDAGISVDNTDPRNPVLFNTGVHSITGTNGVNVDNTDPRHPILGLAATNADQGVDTAGGTSGTYSFAITFTPGARGNIVIGTVTFTTSIANDQVDVWLENDANPGVRLQGITLSSSGAGQQSVTVVALDNPISLTPTHYGVFAQDQGAGTVTVPANGAAVCVQAL